MYARRARISVFIINVNVLFLSNSQPTNGGKKIKLVFIINVNVLFLSNSQQVSLQLCCEVECL